MVEILRVETRDLHVRAERSGFVRELLRGGGSREGYALLLRNLLPAYQAMENGLDRHRQAPVTRLVRDPRIYRAMHLTADLQGLAGDDWAETVPRLPAGDRYAERIDWASASQPTLLLAHAYVRYLGDLSGGQILRRLLARTLDLSETILTFYAFPQIADVQAFKVGYLATLETAAASATNWDEIVAEAQLAFQLNIDLSEAIQQASQLRMNSAVVV